ncbi:FAD-dependent monooxygenase [Streptomyces rectiverticillatus]|uniref:FAD-dependent monooxygenase n=1 Tax=Streptomyces rectiverticillatus TaxID=173860 RepID=UPI001FE27B39|nr:FAD-dependent monooxygenase [Streptomyces rectiverticillatus]
MQDACNLTWKLALVLRGEAGPGLLAGYDAERRPVGEEVVGRTVRHAAHGIEKDPDDPRTVILREAQPLVGYRGGPLACGPHGPADAPQPGDRAPDCPGPRHPGRPGIPRRRGRIRPPPAVRADLRQAERIPQVGVDSSRKAPYIHIGWICYASWSSLDSCDSVVPTARGPSSCCPR